jgi:hypothetical protein
MLFGFPFVKSPGFIGNKRAFLLIRSMLIIAHRFNQGGLQMTNLTQLIDDLGSLKAQIAELTIREKPLDLRDSPRNARYGGCA